MSHAREHDASLLVGVGIGIVLYSLFDRRWDVVVAALILVVLILFLQDRNDYYCDHHRHSPEFSQHSLVLPTPPPVAEESAPDAAKPASAVVPDAEIAKASERWSMAISESRSPLPRGWQPVL